MSTTNSLPPVLQSDLQILLNIENAHKGLSPSKWGFTDLEALAGDITQLVGALQKYGETRSDIYYDLAKDYGCCGEDNTTLFQAAAEFNRTGSYTDLVNDMTNLDSDWGNNYIMNDINELLHPQ
jgi:hypothetical protein